MKSEKDDAWLLKAYSDPDAVANYADGARRFVPGLSDLHRMTGLLLAERVPENARVLVLGAGGGLELKALAEAHAGWTFVGVDPAAEMLTLAERMLGPLNARVTLQQGYIDDVSETAFDAAVCLLTLHFLDADERRRTELEIRRRLKAGAPFVAAHSSFPQADGARAMWLSRYAAFSVASGVDPSLAESARANVDAKLQAITPEQDQAILEEAGFRDVALFYAAFTWRGWVGYA
jgi:tRNA (cmo5U34)-methyltransferase